MTRLPTLAMAALATTALAARPIAAQGAAPRHPVWVNVGLVGTSDEMFGLGAGVTYALTPRRIVTLRALAVEEYSFCINCAPGSLDRTLGAFVRPLRALGFGVAVVADLNAERALAGVLVGVQLGRLRPEWSGWRGRPAASR